MRSRLYDERPSAVLQIRFHHSQSKSGHGPLHFYGFVPWAKRFESFSGGHISAHADADLIREILLRAEVERPIENNTRSSWALGVSKNRLWHRVIHAGNSK